AHRTAGGNPRRDGGLTPGRRPPYHPARACPGLHGRAMPGLPAALERRRPLGSEMNRNATLRFRRVTALLALAWALLALGITIAERLPRPEQPGLPLLIGGLTSQPWRISAVTDEARAAGVAPGDRLLAIDGLPVERALLADD